MHRAKSGRVPNGKLLLSSGIHFLPGTRMCDNMRSIANQGSSHKLWCPEFLLGFHYIGVIGFIINHTVELFSAHLHPWECGLIAHESKCQPSNHIVGFLAWPPLPPFWVTLLAYTIKYALRGPPWITGTLQSLGKYQGFSSYLSGTGTDQTYSLLYNIHVFIHK